MKTKTRNIIAIVIGLVLGVSTTMVVTHWFLSGSAAQLMPADPVIVSSRDSSDHSKALDYCATIIADVRNDGGNGDVVIEIKYSEGAQSWTKSKRERFTANETKTISLDFPEATLGGKGSYEITAR